MDSKQAATAEFLEVAVREGVLTQADADELAAKSEQSKLSISQLCIRDGVLKAVEIEAVEGLLDPDSVAEGYQVNGLLGYGGIGIVYRAHQPGLQRMVALKTVSASRLSSKPNDTRAKAIARFQKEAVAVAKLQHPNIVTAYDFGTTDDRVHLSMELVDGEDLDTFIQRTGPVGTDFAWQVARQVSAALAHAYELGIVHRDIKPANLLLTEPPAGNTLPDGIPIVKVTDFGLARFANESNELPETRLTMAGATMGTPHYMAPEQIEDAKVGFEADIYALGASVFHMLAGEPPLASLPTMRLLTAKMSGESANFDGLPENVGEGTKELVQEMMSLAPEDRPRTYQALIQRIDQILDTGDDSSSRNASVSRSRDTVRVKYNQTLDLDTQSKSSRSIKPYLLAGGAILLALAMVAVAIRPWLTPAPPTPQYRESSTMGMTYSLYRGRTLDGWQGVARADDDSEFVGMLRVFGNANTSIEKARTNLPDSKHFGITFRVALPEGQSLEVWFDSNPDGQIKSMLIEHHRVSIGTRESERDPFEPQGEPVELSKDTLSPHPVIRIDRDESYWLIGQSVPGEPPPPRLIGWLSSESDAPRELRFKADGDAVYIGEIELVGLEKIPDDVTDASPSNR